ncbi:MAG: chorismate synthase [Firmicutes bacterium]|nr:chorismate synthase [Bacillota bacterium]
MIKILSGGFSHSGAYVTILDGVPFGLKVDLNAIDNALLLRRAGLGRSDRQNKEHDKVTVLSGLIDGKTVGAPLCFCVENVLSDKKSFSVARAGHADLAGAIKFGLIGGHDTGGHNNDNSDNVEVNNNADVNVGKIDDGEIENQGEIKAQNESESSSGGIDFSLISERASGRQSVSCVLAGEICCQILACFGVELSAKPLSICGINYENTGQIKKFVDSLKLVGDSAGGTGQVIVHRMAAGFGGYGQRSDRLDGKLAAAVMSVPSIKMVEIGLGAELANMLGSEAADEIIFGSDTGNKDGFINIVNSLSRKSNNAGGIEGGMTNGQDIVIRFAIKPVPTINKQIQSIDFGTNKPALAPQLRSDVCVVEAVTQVAKAAVAIEILNQILLSLGGDTMAELVDRYNKKSCKG